MKKIIFATLLIFTISACGSNSLKDIAIQYVENRGWNYESINETHISFDELKEASVIIDGLKITSFIEKVDSKTEKGIPMSSEESSKWEKYKIMSEMIAEEMDNKPDKNHNKDYLVFTFKNSDNTSHSVVTINGKIDDKTTSWLNNGFYHDQMNIR